MNTPPYPYRILLADDHEVVRSGLRNALNDLPEIKIVGEIGDGLELKRLLPQLNPDCLLIDVAMPNFQPIQDIRAIRANFPDLKILVVSAHDDDVYVQGLLGVGVNGYHMKDQPLSDLRLAVQRVLSGQRWFTGRLLDKLVSPSSQSKNAVSLTKRQKEILRLLQQGYDNQTIARESGLSVKTVENHLTRIYRQLGVQSRLEAVNHISNHPDLLGTHVPYQRPTQVRRPAPAPAHIDHNQLSILIVDDNSRYRAMLRKTLENLLKNGQVLDSSNIAEAVQLTVTHQPRLALIDVVLGNENGIDCTRALAALPNAPRIVMISAYPDREFQRRGREAGASALIDKKDLDIDVLRQILADIN